MDITIVLAALGMASGVLAIFLAIMAFEVTKGLKPDPDYHTLFWLGFLLLVIGAFLNYQILTISGFLLFVIGLLNEENWKKKRTVHVSKEDQDFRALLTSVLAFVIIVMISLSL